jgi:stress-induced-phosphoprotein 1
MKEFAEGLRRDPKNKAIYNNRCACFIKLLEPNQGLKDAEKAIEIDPLFVRAWARKGTCH